ncbi:hypothetical protein QVD17_01524 [Tagetes erecta]|uniref:Cytochrome P450 n=1 Tax=Tagetes erecta TaxID=13708 RepID=A0AAD8L520_TARER|nr:hypothetical protein QVD17_01524 [Tagetes erecta]
MPRKARKACMVGGYIVPKDCTIFLNVWSIQRDPRYWDIPLEFNSERLFTNNLDTNGNDMKFFLFGSGTLREEFVQIDVLRILIGRIILVD